MRRKRCGRLLPPMTTKLTINCATDCILCNCVLNEAWETGPSLLGRVKWFSEEEEEEKTLFPSKRGGNKHDVLCLGQGARDAVEFYPPSYEKLKCKQIIKRLTNGRIHCEVLSDANESGRGGELHQRARLVSATAAPPLLGNKNLPRSEEGTIWHHIITKVITTKNLEKRYSNGEHVQQN